MKTEPAPTTPSPWGRTLQSFASNYSGDVSEFFFELQLELAERTRKLGNVWAKYDRTLVEGAHAAREIA